MSHFTDTDEALSGTTALTVHYELYGDVQAALARNRISVEHVVWRTFQEIANIGASFGIMYHYFEMEFPRETLRFAVSSAEYEPGGSLGFAISLVEGCPFSVKLSDLPEATRELLGLETDEDALE